jgi:hypothetical protein
MSQLPPGWSESSLFRYEREQRVLHVTTRSLTNHELREVLVGLWARLDRADQRDHIRELEHYFADAPGTFLSGIAAQIRDA